MSTNGKAEIELEISIVNLTYRFRGFDAIRDLKEFCDEHASEESALEEDAERVDPPVPGAG